jgi:peptidoglycan/xylan/chitin deacetylase (PgdA/CDA1 family)
VSDVLVLCYHAVSPSWSAPLSVTPDALEQQLSALVRRGWRGATFSQAVFDPPSQRTLAVTFDDAFASVIERAKPILASLELPGTVFVPTAFMAERQPLKWDGIDQWLQTPDADELLGMDWSDLGELSEHGWEIGSHTCSHPHLMALDDSGVHAELADSLEQCRAKLGGRCQTIAYPYGEVDRRVATIAKDAGYEAGACLDSNLARHNALRWPRIGIYHRDGRLRFQLKRIRLTRLMRASRFWPSTTPTGAHGGASG